MWVAPPRATHDSPIRQFFLPLGNSPCLPDSPLDMGTGGLLTIFGISLAAGASFFFALSESSLFAPGAWKARQLAERSPRPGAVVLQMLKRPPERPATIVSGNTL